MSEALQQPNRPEGFLGLQRPEAKDHSDPPKQHESHPSPRKTYCADLLEEGYIYEPQY